MSEYINHAVGAEYVRLKPQRYNLRIDLRKTNGHISLPERPIGTDYSKEEYQKALDKIGEKLKNDQNFNIALMYWDQLQEGVINTIQYQKVMRGLISNY